MIAKEEGLFEFWSLELKAMYSDLQKRYMPNYKPWYGGSILPGEGDLTLEEATRIARKALQDDFGVTNEVLDTAKLSVAYSEGVMMSEDEPLTKLWLFEFYINPPQKGIAGFGYSVSLLADGSIFSTYDPYAPEDEAQIYHSALYRPLSKEDQVFGMQEAERLNTIINYWSIVSMVGIENALKYDIPENLNIPDINLWSIEGLALFAKEFAPQYDSEPVKNSGIRSKLALLLSAADYKLPTADDIPKEKALSIANAAVKEQLSWSEELLAIYTNPSISFRYEFYDDYSFINNIPTPVWRIGYRLLRPNDNEAQSELDSRVRLGEIPGGAEVYINAQTGEVIFAKQWNGYWEYQKYGEFSYEQEDPDGNG
jgi:hypothetical protein